MTALEQREYVGDVKPWVGVRLRLDDRWFIPLVVAVEAVVAGAAAIAQLDRSSVRLLALGLPLVWVAVMAGAGAYGRTALSAHRFGMLVRPWCSYAGIAAVACVLLGLGLPPAQFALAVAAPLVVGETARLGLRTVLRRRHRNAEAVDRVLAVGPAEAVDELAGTLARTTFHEYVVVGVCATDPDGASTVAPVVARLDDSTTASLGPADRVDDVQRVLGAAADVRATHVLVVPGAWLTGRRLQRLSWGVQEAGLSLVVAPGLLDVADHRLTVRTVGRLTVMEMDPTAGTLRHVVKSAFDRVAAGLLLAVLAPLLGSLALAVRLDSTGPALFRQRRVGRDGREFTMLKFRSMVTDAEQRLAELAQDNDHDGHMFKIRRDPRITRLGWWLRRFSLDELPQLINVLRGEMSLVGPRPPLPVEVARYDDVERRRLRVRPGLTGLWQVSGRSDLSWDETVALDLHYVDNWTLGGDARLLARTTQAVLGGRGAY